MACTDGRQTFGVAPSKSCRSHECDIHRALLVKSTAGVLHARQEAFLEVLES